MRSKHLLMTTALATLFAACTNDDFLDNAKLTPNGDDAARPTVEDVILNVVGDDAAATRLGFNGKYNWEANDTIGALLMDVLNTTKRPSTEPDWQDLAWTSRYELVDYINTDYPFVRQADGTWTTNAKMLEGNYFFTFPFASYSGNREATHNLAEQVQDGVGTAAMQKAYAKNQFFVGYARIHAGTEGADVMSADLDMTPILGAVGITIKNAGNEPFTVKKIVLESTNFSTEIKIDPTRALYNGEDGAAGPYNLAYDKPYPTWAKVTGTKAGYFNYANYEEMYKSGEEWLYNDKFTETYGTNAGDQFYGSGDLVNNTEKSVNYNRKSALRAIINNVDGDKRAELTVLNAPAIQPAKNGVLQQQQFIIMTNPYKYDGVGTNNIKASVYTDKGLVKDVVITNPKGEVAGAGVTVITDNEIKEIGPDKANNTTLQIDINSVSQPTEMNIYNESDLEQFIAWNEGLNRVFTATLKNDIVLTKEMTDMLVADKWKNVKMLVESETGNAKKLIIAEDAATNILDYILVDGDVEIHNNLVIGSKSYLKGEYEIYTINRKLDDNKLVVAEGASLTVASAIDANNAKETEKLVVENEGTFTISADVAALEVTNKAEMSVGAKVTISATSTNEAEAVINIKEGAELATQGNLTNKAVNEDKFAVINNDGTIRNLVNNQYAKVIVGANSVTHLNTNNGIVDITANIKANVKVDGGNSTIAYTLTGTDSMKSLNDAKITELTVDGGTITSSSTTAAKNGNVAKLIVTENGGSIDGTDGSEFTNGSLKVEINGDLTLKNITLGGSNGIDIKAGTTTIEGTVVASNQTITLGSYDNVNYKINAGTLTVKSGSDKLVVADIVKDTNTKVTKEMAVVNNQGTIQVAKVNLADITNNLTWNGTSAIEIPEPVQATDVTIDGTTYANLKALSEAVTKGTVVIDKKITIATTIALSADDKNDNYVGYLKSLANGKEIVIDNGSLTGLTSSMAVSFGTLTIGTSGATISGSNNSVVILTVDKLNINGTLTLTNDFIKMTGTGQIGVGSENITVTGSVSTTDGAIVTVDKDGGYIKFDTNSKKWTNL